MSWEIADRLLERIQELFPKDKMLGPGYGNAVREVLNNKIELLSKQVPSQWDPVANYLAKTYGDRFMDLAFHQFPSYCGTVLLHTKSHEEFKLVSNLQIAVSLLSPFYTIYFEDRYTFNYNSPEFQDPCSVILYSAERKPLITQSIDIQTIKELIEDSFTGYTFVIHDPLFTRTVDAGPPYDYNASELTKEFCIFAYLFNTYQLTTDVQLAPREVTSEGQWIVSPVERKSSL